MKKLSKILLIIAILFLVLVIWRVLELLLENKRLEIDTEVLDNIAAQDWTDADWLESKELLISSYTKSAFGGEYIDEGYYYSVDICLSEPDDSKALREYKNFSYLAAEHTELSLKNLFSQNDDVERVLKIYKDGLLIKIIEHNKAKSDIAFYGFFEKEEKPIKKESPIVSLHDEYEENIEAFIAENETNKNVGDVTNNKAAAKNAIALWKTDLAPYGESFTGGPTVYVSFNFSENYWIVQGTYSRDIFKKDGYNTSNVCGKVPFTIIKTNGDVIANGWK